MVRYYNPVTSLLDKGGKWKGMRNTAQLRREQGAPVPVNKVCFVFCVLSAVCKSYHWLSVLLFLFWVFGVKDQG